MNRLLRMLDIEHPIVQGPMGGGPSTPDLVAAVSNAGGLGSLGAAYLTPEQIVDAVRRIRALTDKPFNVNLFAGGYEPSGPTDPAAMLALLADIHAALELPPPSPPAKSPHPFPEQVEAVLASRPPIFSFTFGIPGSSVLKRFRSGGIVVSARPPRSTRRANWPVPASMRSSCRAKKPERTAVRSPARSRRRWSRPWSWSRPRWAPCQCR